MVDIHFLRYIVPALESPQVQPGKADDSEAEFSRKDNKNPCGNLIVSPSLEIIILFVASLGLEDSGGMVRVGPVHYNTVEEISRFGEALGRITASAL